jgi:hypothetical protein
MVVVTEEILDEYPQRHAPPESKEYPQTDCTGEQHHPDDPKCQHLPHPPQLSALLEAVGRVFSPRKGARYSPPASDDVVWESTDACCRREGAAMEETMDIRVLIAKLVCWSLVGFDILLGGLTTVHDYVGIYSHHYVELTA